MKAVTKLWIGLAILVMLSPIGFILPKHFKTGPAWGEWRTGSIWKAPMPDYAFKGWTEKGLPHLSFAYIISAIIGIGIIAAVMMLIGKILARKDK